MAVSSHECVWAARDLLGSEVGWALPSPVRPPNLSRAPLAKSGVCAVAESPDDDSQGESERSDARGDGRGNDPRGWAVVGKVYFQRHIGASIAQRAGDVEGEDPLSCTFERNAHVEVAYSDLDWVRAERSDGCVRGALCAEG